MSNEIKTSNNEIIDKVDALSNDMKSSKKETSNEIKSSNKETTNEIDALSNDMKSSKKTMTDALNKIDKDVAAISTLLNVNIAMFYAILIIISIQVLLDQ